MTEEYSEDVVQEDKLALLGEPTAEFAVRGLRLVWNLVLAPLLVVAGLATEVLVLALAPHHNLEMLLFGVALIVSGIMLGIRAIRNRGLRVLVFPEGLVRFHRGQAQALLWEQVSKVWLKKHVAGHWTTRAWKGGLSLTLETTEDHRICFDDSLPRLKELVEIVRRETLPHLYARALAAFEAGQTLDFGALRLSRSGLSSVGQSISWGEVKRIEATEAQLTLSKKQKKWRSWAVPVSDISNFHVLRALLEQAVPVARSFKR